MKIKKFNELNEEKTYTDKVQFNPSDYMTAGDLMDYLRKNVPKETLIFYQGCDRPITSIQKNEIYNHMPEIENIYIHENIEKEYKYDEFGKYTYYDEDEEEKSNGKNVTTAGLKNDLAPEVVKAIVINKYM